MNDYSVMILDEELSSSDEEFNVNWEDLIPTEIYRVDKRTAEKHARGFANGGEIACVVNFKTEKIEDTFYPKNDVDNEYLTQMILNEDHEDDFYEEKEELSKLLNEYGI